MAKFVLAYHGGGMPETEAEQAEVMAAWGTWFGGLGESVLDRGSPIVVAKTVASDGSTRDGGGANPLSGYSLVEADSLEAAVEIAKGCPVLATGGSIEVCQTVEM
jgi:hypothetical protein